MWVCVIGREIGHVIVCDRACMMGHEWLIIVEIG